MVLPSGKKSKVKTISTFDGNLDYAFPPESIALTLEDEIDVSRGDMLVHPNNIPRTSRSFEAMLVWMDEKAMDLGTSFFIKHTTQITRARIERLRYRTDVNSLRKSDADYLSLNEIGRVSITTSRPLYFDPYMKNHQTGSFILIDPLTNFTSAVGMIIDRVASENGADKKAAAEVADGSQVSRAAWEGLLGQQGEVHRIAGDTTAEKQIKAYALERRLFEQGKIALVVNEAEVSSDMVDNMKKHGLIVIVIEKGAAG